MPLYPGKIGSRNANGTYNIAYDDGDSESNVPRHRIKAAGEKEKRGLEVGWKVDAKCTSASGEARGGKIARALDNDEYVVAFDHGERETLQRKFICGPYLKPPGGAR